MHTPINCSDYVEPILSIREGHCYTINGTKLQELRGQPNRPGPDFGLQFHVDINQQDYTELSKSIGAGIKVLLTILNLLSLRFATIHFTYTSTLVLQD